MKSKFRVGRSWPHGMRFLQLVILLLSGCTYTNAQNLTLDFIPLSSTDHLSQNTIQCIYQDSYGFMWFGTQDGLNKYDGYRLEVLKFRKNDPNSLPANHITALNEDAEGNLWIGTRTAGLSRYDRSKGVFTRFQKNDKDPNAISSNQINTIFKDSRSNIWIGTPEGINLLEKDASRFRRFPISAAGSLQQKEDVRAVFEDRRKNIWVGTDHSLKVLKKNAAAFISYQLPGKGDYGLTVNTIAEDEDGKIWVGTNKGLELFDAQAGTFSTYAIEPDKNSVGGINPVSYLLKTERNRFWLATNTTLQLFDAGSKQIVPISDQTDGESRMPNDGIYSLFTDRAKVLWIGTSSEGILKMDRNLTIFKSFKASLNNIPSAKNIIRGLADDKLGNLYVATDAGLEYFDRATLTYKKYTHQRDDPASLSSNYTTAVIHSEKTGLVWVGTYGHGLEVLNPKTGRFNHFTKGQTDNSLNSNAIDVLLEDSHGRIWIGTDGGGLNVFDPQAGIFTKYLHRENDESSLCDNTVLALYEDKKGNIWIGGYSKGISILNPVSHTFSQLNSGNSKLTSNVISSFHEDSKGNMWIGTHGGGLNRYNLQTKVFTDFAEESGLVNNSVNYITGDDFGLLWISTNLGITSYDPVKKIFKNFDKNNSLKTMEFNLGAGKKLGTGEIALGSINGFNIIDPSKLTFNRNKPHVVLTGLQLFNKPVSLLTKNSPLKQTILTSKELTLNYFQSVFTITFAAMDYTSPEDNQYAYILEGFDDEWNYTANQHSASYTNLNPGTYTFKVKAANNDGLWGDKQTSLLIHITSPYWMTWWFKSLLVLLVAAVVYRYYLYQMRFVSRQKNHLEILVKQRTAQIRHQSADMKKLNRELLENTASLEQLNQQLTQQKAQEHKARLIAEQAQKQADDANSAKSNFLATMSHELRTPINGVMGMASLLAETSLDNEQKEYTEGILNSGQSLLSVINDVLDFSRIESGNIVLEAHSFDLRKCIEDVLEIFSPNIAESGIDLLYLMDQELAEYVVADSLRLRQILINMVGNAVKFTKRGEVFVKISETGKLGDKLRIQFAIGDTGIGIPADQQKNLFKAFNQLDSSITRKYGGSGLGLVICERLVKLMGGQIDVDSQFGQGTTFTFDILCERSEDLQADINEIENSALKGKNALVVDDNPHSVQAVEMQLQKLKMNVFAANSGEQALQLIAAHREIDVVMTNMKMPHMDGLQLGKQIRQFSDVPLILLGFSRDEHQNSFLPLFSAVLNKPVRLGQLSRSLINTFKVDRSSVGEKKKAKLSEDFAQHYPYKILVAEDILMNQKLIIWVLNKLGYQPDLANNGLEVLDMMKIQHYDIILMDLQMPHMDGLEATRIIRQTYGSTPLIIALTANAMSEDREICLMAGMDDYISKPINLELLTKSLINLHNIHLKSQ